MADSKRFELLLGINLNTLSKRAPSATQPAIQKSGHYTPNPTNNSKKTTSFLNLLEPLPALSVHKTHHLYRLVLRLRQLRRIKYRQL